MELPELKESLRRFFETRPSGVVCAYLFGSRARDEAREHSDVDMGLLFEEDPATTFDGLPLELEADLERFLGRPVQIVPLNRAPADLVHRVLRDGHLVLDRDPCRRIRFEVRRRNEYFDLLPILREYRHPAGASSER